MIREAIDRVVEMARQGGGKWHFQEGDTYYEHPQSGELQHVQKKNNWPHSFTVSTLQSFADFLVENADENELAPGQRIIIHVASATSVAAYLPAAGNYDRRELVVASADEPVMDGDQNFRSTEQAICWLMTNCVPSGDRENLVKFLGNVKDEETVSVLDDGFSQQATVKTGVASVANMEVPNPVVLAPFRTFPEIDPPTSPYLVRLGKGMTVDLLLADGGKWSLDARAAIARFLDDATNESMIVLH